MPQRKPPAKHAYSDWGLQRLHQQTPIYIAENNRPVAEVVRVDKKTVVIKHDKNNSRLTA
jgi:hypothetical protein